MIGPPRPVARNNYRCTECGHIVARKLATAHRPCPHCTGKMALSDYTRNTRRVCISIALPVDVAEVLQSWGKPATLVRDIVVPHVREAARKLEEKQKQAQAEADDEQRECRAWAFDQGESAKDY